MFANEDGSVIVRPFQ